MKILFLDVDGVLNTRPGSLDDDKLDLLGHIVTKTGCKVVISSSWRTVNRMKVRLYRALWHHGIEVYSETPELADQVVAWGFAQAVPRHREIRAWLNRQEVKGNEITGYCILDDDPKADDGTGRYVRTVMEVGLDKVHAQTVIETLNRQI